MLRYFPDDGWLNMDGNENEWAVAFHGIGRHPKFGSSYVTSKIVKEGARVGFQNVYEGKTCSKTGKTIGNGIYVTPHIEIALNYTDRKGNMKIGNENYHMVF